MTLPTFDSFAAEARSHGYPQVLERSWPAGAVVDDHSHPFAVQALVVQGEMWLTAGGATRHLQAGDRFELDRDQPHAERYGEAGATYWAARRE